jgi:hypothetical protein
MHSIPFTLHCTLHFTAQDFTTYLRASLSALMAAFSSSVFWTTSLSSVEDIQRCDVPVPVDVAPDVLVTEEDARRLRRMVVVVVARGAHATATLRADAFRRNRAATILHKQRLLIVENMCLLLFLLQQLVGMVVVHYETHTMKQ